MIFQDKSVRLTNVSSCQEVQRYSLENEAWCCCWNLDRPNQFFVGTKRSEILVFDMTASTTAAEGAADKVELLFLAEFKPTLTT